MADQAGHRKSKRLVVHLAGGLIVFSMAGQAVRLKGPETPPQIIRMTALATQLEVGAFQHEPRALMGPYPRDVLECGRGVTKATVRRQGPGVDIQVTGAALLRGRRGILEMEVFVAGATGSRGVPTHQGKPGDLAMIENRIFLDRGPALVGVAVETVQPLWERSMGVVLGRKARPGHGTP